MHTHHLVGHLGTRSTDLVAPTASEGQLGPGSGSVEWQSRLRRLHPAFADALCVQHLHGPRVNEVLRAPSGASWARLLVAAAHGPAQHGRDPMAPRFASAALSPREPVRPRLAAWQEGVLAAEEAWTTRPSLAAYCTSISQWGRRCRWERGLVLWRQLKERRLEANVIVLNAAVQACEKGEQWLDALSFLREASDAGLRQDSISSSCAITACQRLWQLACHLLGQVVAGARADTEGQSQECLNPVPVTSAISACGAHEAWPSALFLQAGFTARRGQQDLVLCNSAMHAGGKLDRWQHCISALTALERDYLQVNAITYLPVIAGKKETWSMALLLLQRSAAVSLPYNLILCTSVIGACSGGPWQWALHCFGRTRSSRQRRDSFAYNTMLSACAEGDEWQLALCFLQEMESEKLECSIVSYNAAITACAVGSHWLQALRFLQLAVENGLELSIVSFSAAMTACQNCQCWESVLQLLLQLEQSWVQVDAVLISSAMNSWNHAGLWTVGLDLMNKMQSRALKAENRLWNAALRGLQSGTNYWHRSLSLLANFQSKRAELDEVGCNLVMNSLSSGGHWERSISVLECLIDGSLRASEISYASRMMLSDITVQWIRALDCFTKMQVVGLTASLAPYKTAVKACASCNVWRWALCCLDQTAGKRMQADVISCTSALSACVLGEEWQRALCLLEHILNVNLECTLVSYNSAMSACASGSHWQLAMYFLTLLQDQGQADDVSYVAAMSACEAGRRPQQVFSLLAQFEEDGIEASSLPLTSAVSVCSKGRDWELALALVERLQSRTLQKNVVSHNAALGAFRGEQWHRGIHLVRQLGAIGLQATDVTYGSIVSTCEIVGPWQWSLQLTQHLQRQRIQRSRIALTSAITACGAGTQWEWALYLLGDLQATCMESDVVVYNVALSACQLAAQWQHALHVFEEIQKQSLEATVQTFSGAVGACEQGRHTQAAISLMEQMEGTACYQEF